MGQARRPEPVNLICAALAGRQEWLAEARHLLERRFGPVGLQAGPWPWEFTDYYAPQMGTDLLRMLWSFRDLLAPEALTEVKLFTNAMEREMARLLPDAPPRPVNLDPGYLTLTKLVLATTKDAPHRLYLREGIYAEVTLRWHAGRFEPWEWTYPDYRTEPYLDFFARVRAAYRRKLRAARRP